MDETEQVCGIWYFLIWNRKQIAPKGLSGRQLGKLYDYVSWSSAIEHVLNNLLSLLAVVPVSPKQELCYDIPGGANNSQWNGNDS